MLRSALPRRSLDLQSLFSIRERRTRANPARILEDDSLSVTYVAYVSRERSWSSGLFQRQSQVYNKNGEWSGGVHPGSGTICELTRALLAKTFRFYLSNV